MNMNEHILGNYNSATHSIIKEFVMASDLSEPQRLARIAVMHAVIDAPEGNLGAYTHKLLNIITRGEASLVLAKQAVKAVKELQISGMNIITDYRLNEFGMTLVHSIAEAVTTLMPERCLPMHNCSSAPDNSFFVSMNIEQTAAVKTNLFKNGMCLYRVKAPRVFAALDVLWSEQYTLNNHIMNLVNLPAEYSNRQFALGYSPAFADTFSFRFTLDHRGRTYARSMYAQPQGDSFSKAVLNMGTKKALGAKGLNALGIHYANVSGHDKLSLQERVQWARSQGMVKSIDMVNTCGDWAKIVTHLESKEKDGFEEYAAAIEYYNAVNACDSTKYESNLVCHQDATNSGFQFGAALLGDLQAARATNLLASHYSENPEDLYLEVAQSMINNLDEAHKETWADVINRIAVKKAVMVTGYGAGEDSQMEAFCVGLEKIGKEELCDRVDEVKDALFAALEEHASALLMFTAAMKAHAKSKDEGIAWTTEDGMWVKHDYQEVEEYGLGKYKVVANRRAGLNKAKNSSSLPPNFIHSIDGNMLRVGAVKARANNIAYVPIHDSFGTHACDFFDLGRILRESFIETMAYDWYDSFCSRNEFEPKVKNKRDFDIYGVRGSTYMFS